MIMKDAQYYKSLDYDIIIKREKEESQVWYIAYCEEFGKDACFGQGVTREDALVSFLSEKDFFIDFLISRGENVPEPSEDSQSCSGKFSVRTSRWLHETLVRESKKNDVSLNAYVNQLLAYGAGKDVAQSGISSFADGLSDKMDYQFSTIMNLMNSIRYNMPNYKIAEDNKTYLEVA